MLRTIEIERPGVVFIIENVYWENPILWDTCPTKQNFVQPQESEWFSTGNQVLKFKQTHTSVYIFNLFL